MSHPSRDISQDITQDSGQDVGQGETFHLGRTAPPSTSTNQPQTLSHGRWSGSFGVLPSELLSPKLFLQGLQPAHLILENTATQRIFRNRDLIK